MANFANLGKRAQLLFGLDPSTTIEDVSTGSTLLIESADPDDQEPISIVLSGHSMPFSDQGIDFGLQQRVNTTWLQGNPVALQQIMGPKCLDTVFEGEWNYRFIQGEIDVTGPNINTDIRSPSDAVDLFNTLLNRGKPLKVEYLNITRIGILSEFVPKYFRLQDIGWKLKFEWQSQGENTFRSALTPPTRASDGISLFKALQDNIGKIPGFLNLAQAAVATVITQIDEIGDVINDLLVAVEIAQTITSAPGQIFGKIKNTISDLIDKVNELIRNTLSPNAAEFLTVTTGVPLVNPLERVLPKKNIPSTTNTDSTDSTSSIDSTSSTSTTSVTTSTTSGAAPLNSNTVNQLKLEIWKRQIQFDLYQLINWALYIQEDLKQQLIPTGNVTNTKRVYSKDNDTLYSISTRYYNSPDYASFIGAINNLPYTVLEPGTEIIIPPKPTLASSFNYSGSSQTRK